MVGSLKLHPEAAHIAARLKKEQISELYHFTDVENLPLIAQIGELWCKRRLKEGGFWPNVRPGGNSLSQNLNGKLGNAEKVELNFSPHTPMAFYKKQDSHLCFFCVSVDVAQWDGVLFTDFNAASPTAERMAGPSGLDLVDFDEIRSITRPEDRAWIDGVQAEVLVPQAIPFSQVLRVAFVSQASLAYGELLWGPSPHPTFCVEPALFDNTRGRSKPVIPFPYVIDAILTPETVNKENAYSSHKHVLQFDRATHQHVTVLAHVVASAGLKGTMRWSPGDRAIASKFDRPSRYAWWAETPMEQLSLGENAIDLLLNDIQWSRIKFTVT